MPARPSDLPRGPRPAPAQCTTAAVVRRKDWRLISSSNRLSLHPTVQNSSATSLQSHPARGGCYIRSASAPPPRCHRSTWSEMDRSEEHTSELQSLRHLV